MQPPPIRSLYADDPEMTDLVKRFVGNLPNRMASLEALSEKPADTQEYQRLAHQLRGALGGYGFPQLCEAAGRLEEALKQRQAADAKKALLDLLELSRRACQEGQA